MKSAIITGSTGLLGVPLARHLALTGVQVLCLGRRNLCSTEVRGLFGNDVHYLPLPMSDIGTLSGALDSSHWRPEGDCVFFNFAWGGDTRLTDGSLGRQIDNAIWSAEAVKAAADIGCIRFINSGTLEETFAEEWLAKGADHPFTGTQTNYTIAKLAARDMCKIVGYLHRIDYVHTRLSIPLDFSLARGSYITNTLKKIARGEQYERPINARVFDIISTDDVSKAFLLIGKHGRNKADYFIGTSRPSTLGGYFEFLERVVRGNCESDRVVAAAKDSSLFATASLQADTGFAATDRFEDLCFSLINR